MSYILDALKRAERERRAGAPPSLLDETPATSAALPGAAWRRWALPALIATVALAVLLYLLLGRSQAPASPGVTTRPAQIAAPVAVAPTMPAIPASPLPIAPPSAAPAEDVDSGDTATIEDDGQIANLNDLDDSAAAEEEAQAQAQAEAEAQAQETPDDSVDAVAAEDDGGDGSDSGGSATAQLRPTPVVPITPPSRSGSSSGARGKTSATRPTPASPAEVAAVAAAESQAGTAGADSKTADGGAQNLREMPDAFRANFPQITVDVHSYGRDPAERFVLIGGKRFREGDSLPQGPRIVDIVSAGIVFDWQGQRVLYAMNR